MCTFHANKSIFEEKRNSASLNNVQLRESLISVFLSENYLMLSVLLQNDENTYGFETPSRAACKHLYKCCREHHSFFQLVHVSTNTPDVVNTRFRLVFFSFYCSYCFGYCFQRISKIYREKITIIRG